jgi:hypothetical protein
VAVNRTVSSLKFSLSQKRVVNKLTEGRVRRASRAARTGEMRSAYKIFVEKPERKRPHGRSTRRWQDIKMGLTEIGWEGVNWIRVAQNRTEGRLL